MHFKNNEPRPKFTGSFLKKACIYLFVCLYCLYFAINISSIIACVKLLLLLLVLSLWAGSRPPVRRVIIPTKTKNFFTHIILSHAYITKKVLLPHKKMTSFEFSFQIMFNPNSNFQSIIRILDETETILALNGLTNSTL